MSAASEIVVLGLGSNLGESASILGCTCTRLATFARGPLLRSSCWRTAPVDCPPGSPHFLNAVVAFEPRYGLEPVTLLYRLKMLERQFGRRHPVPHHAPRELDIDLLLFGDRQLSSEWLELPHPRALVRRFVLAPAAELLPQLRWPGCEGTLVDQLRHLPSGEAVERVEVPGW